VKAILSILMSVVLLTTNLGWIQTTHYCLGRPIEANVRLEISHLSCGMVMTSGCSEEMQQKPGCCHNEFDIFSLDQHLLTTGLDFVPLQFLVALPPVETPRLIENTVAASQRAVDFTHEKPPPRSRHLFVFYQQWII